jgi:hypothetical protein
MNGEQRQGNGDVRVKAAMRSSRFNVERHTRKQSLAKGFDGME